MKFIRLMFLICAILSVVVAPLQANWLARATAHIKGLVVHSGLATTKQVKAPAPITQKQIKVSAEKTGVDVNKPKIVSREEIEKFKCRRGWFCGKIVMESSGDYFSFGGNNNAAVSGWEKTIMCPKCNTYLKSSSVQSVEENSEKATALPENCVDAEYKIEGKQQNKAEKSEIKALPTTSIPEKGFYARVKAMFRKK